MLIICAALALSACANSPMRVSMMSPETLQEQRSDILCRTYGYAKTQNVKAELVRREQITAKEWDSIDDKAIFMGMSELALLCSFGQPGLYGAINTSTGSWGTHRQWVYRSCKSCPAMYVYTRDGYVTSWQN